MNTELINKDNKRISKDYNYIIDELAKLNIFITCPINFYFDDKTNTGAYYTYRYKTISVNNHYSYNVNLKSTLIHEIAHHICHEADINRNHTLEFAIINQVLNRVINEKKKYHFWPYDIFEDKSYKDMSFNMNNWDKFINEIKFKSLTELIDIAVTEAMNIRRNKGL